MVERVPPQGAPTWWEPKGTSCFCIPKISGFVLFGLTCTTIDRESSRDRAPVGLVRCICKDDQVKGQHVPVEFKLSNIHAFVPIWMAPTMLRNFRLIAEQSSPLSPLGQLRLVCHRPQRRRTRRNALWYSSAPNGQIPGL